MRARSDSSSQFAVGCGPEMSDRAFHAITSDSQTTLNASIVSRRSRRSLFVATAPAGASGSSGLV